MTETHIKQQLAINGGVKVLQPVPGPCDSRRRGKEGRREGHREGILFNYLGGYGFHGR